MNIYTYDVERLLNLNSLREYVLFFFGLISFYSLMSFELKWTKIVVIISLNLLLFLSYRQLIKYLAKDVKSVISALECDIYTLGEEIEFYEAERKRYNDVKAVVYALEMDFDAPGENIEYYEVERKKYTEVTGRTDDFNLYEFMHEQSEFCKDEGKYLREKQDLYREYVNRLNSKFDKYLKKKKI